MDIHVAFTKIQATLSEDITPFKVTQQFMPCFSTKFIPPDHVDDPESN